MRLISLDSEPADTGRYSGPAPSAPVAVAVTTPAAASAYHFSRSLTF